MPKQLDLRLWFCTREGDCSFWWGGFLQWAELRRLLGWELGLWAPRKLLQPSSFGTSGQGSPGPGENKTQCESWVQEQVESLQVHLILSGDLRDIPFLG